VIIGGGHDGRIVHPDRGEPEITIGPHRIQFRGLEIEDHEFGREVGLRSPVLYASDQGFRPVRADGLDVEAVVGGRFRQAVQFGFPVEVDAPDLTGLELPGDRLLELDEDEAGLVVDGPIDQAAGRQRQVAEVQARRGSVRR
jgi:hypothetical protein